MGIFLDGAKEPIASGEFVQLLNIMMRKLNGIGFVNYIADAQQEAESQVFALTRADIALQFLRISKDNGMYTSCVKSFFADCNSLDSHTMNAVSFAAAQGIFDLDNDGNFNPMSTVSTEEGTKIVLRIFEFLLDKDALIIE